jgi:hypothetical protein
MIRSTSSPAIRPASRVAGALRVVEVRRHGDDCAIDFEVEFSLLAEVLLARCFNSPRMRAEISDGVYSRFPSAIRTTPPGSPLTPRRRNAASSRTSSHVAP